jgi:ABC-type sugar transport system substrate-binding protein
MLQTAAANGLVAAAALTVPSSITVQGQLVNTALTQRVSGFDLSPVNKYKWNPTIERIEHDRYVGSAAVQPV